MSLSGKNWKKTKKFQKPKSCRQLPLGTIHLRRRHVLGGEGGSPLPMFANARGVGVLGLRTSAIFESIRRYFCKKSMRNQWKNSQLIILLE